MRGRFEQALAEARKSRWLAGQSPAFQNAITAAMTMRLLKRDENLFQVEDESHEIYYLVSGALVGRLAHPVQGMQLGHTVLPGSWFGDPGTLGRKPRIVSVQARRSSVLLAISQVALERMLRSAPEHAWPLFNLMAYNSQEYLLRSIDLLIHDPRLRMCSRLLTLAGRLSHYLPPSPVSIPINREELAEASNLSRQSVHVFLGELVQQGICSLRYREIKVLDMQALAGVVDREYSAD